jgi:hypothetical protein
VPGIALDTLSQENDEEELTLFKIKLNRAVTRSDTDINFRLFSGYRKTNSLASVGEI